MTRLFFIRHGKTIWNLEGRYQGAKGDSELLPESHTEIKMLANYLKNEKFEKIYCSPIKRAFVTASELARALPQELAVEKNIGLSEFNLGEMEGMLFTDVAKKFPRELDAFRNHPDLYNAKNISGESFQELFSRMTPIIQRICKEHPNGNVIIVSHGAALCAEIRHLLGYSLEDLRKAGGLSNTSTTILKTNDAVNFDCLEWNKTDYLNRKLDQSDTV
ncbi:MAG: histidine phosphatase family protein [Liquorilactobacillus hordei]|uniref:Phosphoglycerate mutase n=1 Tax=Liquorilactobacillus hordei DSM 19519 TaxID=1423759 RepID=A0A0R1MR48_9LACO|nr:histidine phosphatase family protein [Liquorilactobacillus hordei]KRL07682.1 phosphoglycerate mutase [Liquorilactobacillus hordei DSM 19519]QYH52646.1 histidine phosphatase family protein [Liquorilactobacillus hordei DSM 19519]